MKNGGAEQCLLTAAEDGEILPREAFSPRSTVFMVARQGGQSCSPREAWDKDSKQLNCFLELRRQPARCSKPAPAPATQVLHPGAGTRKVAKKFGGRSTLCGSSWHPARLHRPPPGCEACLFLDPTVLCIFGPWLPHTHRRRGRRKGAPLLGTAKNA